jgi:hypothetical protein
MPLEWDWLQPFEAVFSGVADLDHTLFDPNTGVSMGVESAAIDTPVELDVRVDESGAVSLLGAPPTQHVETTYMPVFHRMRIAVRGDGDG